MKTILILFVMIGSSVFVQDLQENEKSTLTVQISGIRNNNGYVLLALHDGSGDFPDDDEPFMLGEAEAEDGSVTVTFEDVPNGEYAIAVMHDENGNQEFDVNEYGMPLEGYGFSMNPESQMGAPSFSDASFEVEGDKDLDIDLIYLN